MAIKAAISVSFVRDRLVAFYVVFFNFQDAIA